jgi:predicted nucleic acid-binding Zn ribbon protein
VSEDGDLRPDAELLGGFSAQPLPTRAEPAAPEPNRLEPNRLEPELPLNPEPRNSSESGFESEFGGNGEQPNPVPEQAKEVEHDKQGLDLARSVAGRLKGMNGNGPAKPVRKIRRRRSNDPLSSGARPDDRDPQPLTSALGRLMWEQGWEVEAAVHGVMARWPSIVGAEIAQHCKPESYTDTELTVRTDSTAWATQVRLLAPELVRRLNAELGDGTVTRVNVQGPNAPSWRKGPRTVRGGRGPRDTYG